MKKFSLLLLVMVFIGACNQQPLPTDLITIQPQATTYKYYLPTTAGTTIKTDSNNYHNTNGHPSIDFLPGAGGTSMPIAAMRGGTVTVARSNLGRCDTGNVPTVCPGDTYYGNVVMIQHSDGSYALYAHLAQNSIPTAVVVGATVTTGQVIGQMGLTGNTSGHHLHLEVRASGGTNGVLGNYEFGAVRPSFVEANNSEAVPGVIYTSQNTPIIPTSCTQNYAWTPGGAWTRQILDNDQDLSEGQGFEKLGQFPQYWWLDGGNGSGGDTIYTYSGNVPDENYGRWSTYVPRGKYDVYAYIPLASGNGDNQSLGNAYADNVNYKVQSFSGTVYYTAVINQSANKGCWVKLGGDFVWAQGDRVAVQLGDNVSGASGRRIYYDDIAYYRTARPIWALAPSGLTLPAGTVGGTTSNATFTVTNTGNLLGVGALNATNGFTTSQTSALLDANQTLSLTVTAPACSVVGTQSSNITMSGDDASTTLNVSRVCNAAPAVSWSATPTSLTLSPGTVGGISSSQTFEISNTGNTSGTYVLAATNNFTVSPTTGTLANGANATITVTSPVCTVAGNQISTISGAVNVSVTRACNAAPVPNPPTAVGLANSSNGRIFLNYAEAPSTSVYEFLGTFDNQPVNFSTTVPATGNGSKGAVLMWADSNPQDPAKQNKALCIQMRSKSSAGATSAYTTATCTTYKYYAATSLLQADHRPVIKISLP